MWRSGRAIPLFTLRDSDKLFCSIGMDLQDFDGLGLGLGVDFTAEVDNSITYRGEGLRGVTRPYPAGIFAEGHVSDAVQLVLNPPVISGDTSAGLRRRPVSMIGW